MRVKQPGCSYSRCQQWLQIIEDTVEPPFLPGIISLFIICVGIIWNNSLVEGVCAQTELWIWLLRYIMLHCIGARVHWLLSCMGRSKLSKSVSWLINRNTSACMIYYPKKDVSRDLFEFWEINDNISLMVQGSNMVAMEHK